MAEFAEHPEYRTFANQGSNRFRLKACCDNFEEQRTMSKNLRALGYKVVELVFSAKWPMSVWICDDYSTEKELNYRSNP